MYSDRQRGSEKKDKTYLTFTGIFKDVWSSEGWALMCKHRVWRPPTDVYETDSHVVVRVEVAGVQKKDFQISLSERRLIISG